MTTLDKPKAAHAVTSLDEYRSFVETKRIVSSPVGIINVPPLHSSLFPFQRDITAWALRRGRAALFEDCGLGKSRQSLEWARVVSEHTQHPVLIVTPLAVAQQFVAEGQAVGIDVTHIREASDVSSSGVNVVNYERFGKLDPKMFGGVVLDESSILKSYDSKTRNLLIESFDCTPFKLACTATPAPNDHIELGNHAEFLGVMSRTEMLSMFFVHDGGDTQSWRLKGHAQRDFWRWVCSWAVSLVRPGDLGYSNSGYDLPELLLHEHVIQSTDELARKTGMLFATEAKTLGEQRAARKASLADRVAKAAELANSNSNQWIIWCGLNEESAALAKSIDGAVEVTGSDSPEHKERTIERFAAGEIRCVVSKSSIFGFGVNMQHCHETAFVGLSHSFEELYQSLRRLWRFGQKNTVNAHIITSSAEGAVLENVKRKQEDFAAMTRGMVAHMSDITREEITATRRDFVDYQPRKRIEFPAWLGQEGA